VFVMRSSSISIFANTVKWSTVVLDNRLLKSDMIRAVAGAGRFKKALSGASLIFISRLPSNLHDHAEVLRNGTRRFLAT